MINKKIKKIISTIIFLLSVVIIIFSCYKIADTMGLFNKDKTSTLNIVENITYNESSFTFSWDAIENANEYTININGETIQVNTNNYFYIPTEEVTEFKVKAIDTSGSYEDSAWSNIYTYNIQKTNNLFLDVNVFVDDMIRGRKLKKIISMHIESNSEGSILFTGVVCEFEGKDYFYNVQTQYDENIESIEQAMKLGNEDTYIGLKNNIVDYNSAEHLLKSNSFKGELEEYRKQGYEISVISSQTVEMEGAEDGEAFKIYATYKLEKDGIIKYVQATYQCEINNPSSNPVLNYTQRLEEPDDRALYQLSFCELTGDFEEFAKQLEKVNQLQQSDN